MPSDPSERWDPSHSRQKPGRATLILFGLLGLSVAFFVLAAATILLWPALTTEEPEPLPPVESILHEFLPEDGSGSLSRLAWVSLQDGVWDTRTFSISTANPELRALLAALDERVRSESNLPDGRAILVVTQWQPDLKKGTLRLFWQGEEGRELSLSRSVYLHQATVGLDDDPFAHMTPAAVTGLSIANGASIYADECANCHGVAGRGIPGIAPPLDDAQFFVDRMNQLNHQGDLRGFVRGAVAAGRPALQNTLYDSVMEPWSTAFSGSLTDDEVDDVTNFIFNWHTLSSGDNRFETLPPADGIPAQGQALFGSLDCLGCHGWPNQGGITGPDLAGVAARKSQQKFDLNGEGNVRISLLAPSAGIANDCPTGPCPDMMPRDYGVHLTSLEIEQLVRFMLTLVDEPNRQRRAGAPPPLVGGLATTRPDQTFDSLARGRTLYEDHCMACHGDRGQGALATGLEAVLRSDHPQDYARAATAQGVPGIMPAWDQQAGGPLAETDLDDVAAYVVQLLQAGQ